MAKTQKISTHLWFDSQAQDAAIFYTGIFKDSGIDKISHYSKEGYEIHKMPEGRVMTVQFRIEGQKFLALNGGPLFKFNESISFMVNCDTQDEIDYYWEKLSQDGDKTAQQCGWLKDKFGVSWQVVPSKLGEWISDANIEKSARVMKVFLRMKKIDIKELEEAYKV